jgi:hypothetical protein
MQRQVKYQLSHIANSIIIKNAIILSIIHTIFNTRDTVVTLLLAFGTDSVVFFAFYFKARRLESQIIKISLGLSNPKEPKQDSKK